MFKVDVSFSQIILKQNFEMIIKVLRQHRLTMTKLTAGLTDFSKKMPNLSVFEGFQDELQNHQQRIEILEGAQGQDDKIVNLEAKQNQQDIAILELQNKDNEQQEEINRLQEELKKYQEQDVMGELAKLKFDLHLLQDQFNELQEKQRLLVELQNSGGDNNNVSNEIIAELRNQINKLKASISEIKQKCIDFAEKIELQDFAEKIELQLQDFAKKAELEEAKLTLEKSIQNLEDDLHSNYVLKTDFGDLQYQFQNLRDNYLREKFSEIDQSIEGATSDISGMKLQIQQIYELFNNINKNAGIKEIQIPIIQPPPQIDNTKLKNLEGRIRALENQVQEMSGKIKENAGNIKLLKENLKENVDILKEQKMDKSSDKAQSVLDQLNSIRERINFVSNQLQSTDFLTKQNADDIKLLFTKLATKQSTKQIPQQKEPQIDEIQILALIKQETDRVTEDLMKVIDAILKEMAEKATKDELSRHEEMMKKIIEEIMQQLKTLADKAETKKSFSYLEKKINEIYQLAMQDKNKSDDVPTQGNKFQIIDQLNYHQGPIYSLHYVNEITKKAHEAMNYKNFDPEFDSNQKPKTSSPNDWQSSNQFTSNFVPQMFKPSNTMYTLKPVNTKIIINTANFQNVNVKESGKGIHTVHNQLGFVKNLKKETRQSKKYADKPFLQKNE